ncbi:hypothetical protein LN040_09920 [Desulfovibrio subterraneus]|uniref:hypothetical protein n=1 Tax=Desulfovibrio subterraneus TaxID=2718620 RepID=UPI0022B923BD|nr:hypothetical protein [Desulfovibrio subterraneus]WBF66049.1 hypothetical protein LN040_09920 [Desulfovibrio subterraneus]
MTHYVNLHRRFHFLTEEALADPDHLVMLSEHDLGGSVGWAEVLELPRAVVLAEAGSGKTREMQEQAARLASEGKFAFFFPLEQLATETNDELTDSIQLTSWAAEANSSAWFFLDAVDELKMSDIKFERALQRLARIIGSNFRRAHVLISSRPHDWLPNIDGPKIDKYLPLPPQIMNTIQESSGDVFVKVLQRKHEPPPTTKENTSKSSTTYKTLALAPLTNTLIKLYVENSGVSDSADFLAELERTEAWTFARRPLDLTELVDLWKESGRIGSQRDLHESNILIKLKDDPERADRGELTDEKAHEGAERLALALTLRRALLIKSPGACNLSGREGRSVEPAEILSDWTPRERQTLLRRALFDPATYGRVRFHHRSVQEYLAAQRFQNLRDKGMTFKAISRLLFSEQYGVRVIRPTMRPIAAWLCIWDSDIRNEVIKREPEVLLSKGDPSCLELDAKRSLLRSFVARYGKGGWRGIDLPHNEIRRLATPELASTVRELWGAGPTNPEVRELLISIIWMGAISECSDLALAAAANPDWNDYDRVVAIKALIACGQVETVQSLANDMLGVGEAWTDRLVHNVVADLFPRFISAEALLTLVERIPEPKDSVRGFKWVLPTIVGEVVPGTDSAAVLIVGLRKLLWEGRDEGAHLFSLRSSYNYLCQSLAKLCEAELKHSGGVVSREVLDGCIVASRFSGEYYAPKDWNVDLTQFFVDSPSLRQQMFWAEIEFAEGLSEESDPHKFYNDATFHNFLGILKEDDRKWLMEDLSKIRPLQERLFALYALLDLWRMAGRRDSDLEDIKRVANGCVEIEKSIDEYFVPILPNKTFEEHERKREANAVTRATAEAERIAGWIEWKDGVLKDIDFAFVEAVWRSTVHNVYSWLVESRSGGDRYNVWNRALVVQAFSSEFADRLQKELGRYWRTVSPTLWSKKPKEERNSTPYDWIYGLCGVVAESENSGWAEKLSADEAQKATRYATVELNGFATFITDVIKAHPHAVRVVIKEEILAEIEECDIHDHLPLLHDLRYANKELKALLSPVLTEVVTTWPKDFAESAANRRAKHLSDILYILAEVSSDAERQQIIEECVRRCRLATTWSHVRPWISAQFNLSPIEGATELERQFESEEDSSLLGIEVFATLFGNRTSISFESIEPDLRAKVLGKLVRYAYAIVRREDDLIHDGVYTPNQRDDAQSARNTLLSALIDTPGIEARRVLLELAEEPNFSHFPERLKHLAQKRAATDAELVPLSYREIEAIEGKLEAPPHDRDGLFDIMLDRLEDLAHDIAHGDFSDRRTLRTIKDEPEMQRSLAWKLDAKSKGAFIVTREDEVADQKRTDIRLSAVQGGQKAVIEIKLADTRWSLTDLVKALRNQLVGQYLRHESCKAGCLLLTFNGQKTYWVQPGTKKRLSFEKMVEYLNQIAKEIQAERLYDIRIKVLGLDLTDPYLQPAH